MSQNVTHTLKYLSRTYSPAYEQYTAVDKQSFTGAEEVWVGFVSAELLIF